MSEKQESRSRSYRLSFHQYFMLGIMLYFSFTGMAGKEDIAFFVFSIMYTVFLAKIVFPSVTTAPPPPVFGEKNRTLAVYVMVGGVVGLFIPLAYVIQGSVINDYGEVVSSAVPHLFLLCSQIFMEGVSFSSQFSLPVRAFVPIFYNSKRLFTIVNWLNVVFREVQAEDKEGLGWMLETGRILAIANLAFWSFNLFGFLLPVYLPKVFKNYHGNLSKP